MFKFEHPPTPGNVQLDEVAFWEALGRQRSDTKTAAFTAGYNAGYLFNMLAESTNVAKSITQELVQQVFDSACDRTIVVPGGEDITEVGVSANELSGTFSAGILSGSYRQQGLLE